MTREHLKRVLQDYDQHLSDLWPGLVEEQLTRPETESKATTISHGWKVAHLKFMCIEAQTFVDQNRIEKAMRWLGFLQGALWSHNHFSLEELKNHSKPPAAVVDAEALKTRVEELMVGVRMAANKYTGKTAKINIIPVKGLVQSRVIAELVTELYVEGCTSLALNSLPDGSTDFTFTLPKEST